MRGGIGVIAWSIIVLLLLSVTWTTWKTRQILRKSLGRHLRAGEESSLRTWMQLSDESLDSANRELARDPFARVLRFLEKLRIWSPPPQGGGIGT
jgi:hypothetical protein